MLHLQGCKVYCKWNGCREFDISHCGIHWSNNQSNLISTWHLRGWKLGNFIKVTFRLHCLTVKSWSFSLKIPLCNGVQDLLVRVHLIVCKNKLFRCCFVNVTIQQANIKQNLRLINISDVILCFNVLRLCFCADLLNPQQRMMFQSIKYWQWTHTQKRG